MDSQQIMLIIHQFSEAVFVDDVDFDISKYKHEKHGEAFNITEKGNNYLKGNIKCDADNILQIPIPNNKGWTVTRNGKPVPTISVNGGFIGIEVEKGVNNIELNFASPNIKFGALLTCIGVGLLICVRNKIYNWPEVK